MKTSSCLQIEVGRRSAGGVETFDSPVETVLRLRELRRTKQLAGPVEVRLHAGVYELPEGLIFGPEDLGDAASPVTFRTAGDGDVVLSGGRRLTGFEPHAGAVMKLDLRKAGLAGMRFSQLLFNGQRQPLARYPNQDAANPHTGGFLRREGVPANFYHDGFGFKDRFTCRDPRLRAWTRIDEVELVVFPRYNWTNNIVRLKSYDAEAGVVVLAEPCTYEIYPGDRLYFRNVREELDAPGEWYLDAAAEVVYFWPPAPLDGATVHVPAVENVIRIADREPARVPELTERGFITFAGSPGSRLIVEGSLGAAVAFRNVRACSLVDCMVRNAGTKGVDIEGGYACAVSRCEVTSTGQTGIRVNGGIRNVRHGRFEPCRHTVEGCRVHDVIVETPKWGGCIDLRGVGVVAARNELFDSPRSGVVFGGNDHVIARNELHHLGTETGDFGAINCCMRDHTMRGTRIHGNFIHDMLGYGRRWDRPEFESPHYAFGIYLDDYSDGIEITGNRVVGTTCAGIFIHDGSDNVVENNIVVGCHEALFMMKRQNWWREFGFCGTVGQGTRRNVFRRNLLINTRRESPVYLMQYPPSTYAWPGMRGEVPLPGDGLAAIPDCLLDEGRPVAIRRLEGDDIDLYAALLGGPESEGLRAQIPIAFLYRRLTSPTAQTVRWQVGLEHNARVWVNGQLVADCRADENAEYRAVTLRVLDLPLRAGENCVAVRLLCGGRRWRLCGGLLHAPGGAVAWEPAWTVFGPFDNPRIMEWPARVTHQQVLSEALDGNVIEDNVIWSLVPFKAVADRFNLDWDAWQSHGLDRTSCVIGPSEFPDLPTLLNVPDAEPFRSLGILPLPEVGNLP